MDLSGYPKTKRLKDNVNIILRPLIREDKDELLRFYKNLPEKDRLFLKYDVLKEENIQKRIDNINYSEELPIITLFENTIIGDATLYKATYGWSRHIGEIRVVVAREYQKKGLGTLLAKELVDKAMNMGIDKITAEMAEEQFSAIKAFSKLGFVQEAILKDFVMDLRGAKHNLVIMSNDVSQLWKKMEEMLFDWYPID